MYDALVQNPNAGMSVQPRLSVLLTLGQGLLSKEARSFDFVANGLFYCVHAIRMEGLDKTPMLHAICCTVHMAVCRLNRFTDRHGLSRGWCLEWRFGGLSLGTTLCLARDPRRPAASDMDWWRCRVKHSGYSRGKDKV